MLQTGLDVERLIAVVVVGIEGVINRLRHFDVNAADLIHEGHERLKVDAHVVINVNSQVALDRQCRQRRPPAGIIIEIPQVVRRVDAPIAGSGDLDPQVARDGKHSRLQGDGVEREDHHGVGAPGGFIPLSALINAQQQHGEALCAGPFGQGLSLREDDILTRGLLLRGREIWQQLRSRRHLPHAEKCHHCRRAGDDHIDQHQPKPHQRLESFGPRSVLLCHHKPRLYHRCPSIIQHQTSGEPQRFPDARGRSLLKETLADRGNRRREEG
ncbi:MAG: hypothetical protein BWY25_02012 [Chloroflexi bacterium ADurb.Bin222]|nr:MAG: hypothetical protein BWY25_02012 [Chloroflexi bacterium ADurb.Bin222]